MFAVGAGCAKLWHWGVLLISKSPQSYSGIIVEAHIIIIPIPAFRNDNMLIDGVLSVSFYWQKKKKKQGILETYDRSFFCFLFPIEK